MIENSDPSRSGARVRRVEAGGLASDLCVTSLYDTGLRFMMFTLKGHPHLSRMYLYTPGHGCARIDTIHQ